ncbi:MAG: HEAT repeat domain-containing protein [Planctomycetes bacterium]|nr:HEAT repeat domain-containing protein [Planctomycetota bacterium]
MMRRAARNNRDLTKDIEPLREVYDRALKAVTTQIAGSGVVYTDVLATKEKAEKELQAASARAYGEERVLESAVAGLGRALALAQGEGRQKALDTVIKLAEKDQDPEVRVRAVDALGRVDAAPVREKLRELVEKSADLRLRLAALDSLARLADEDTVELAIGSLLQDAEWRMRAAAMRFLVKVPRKNAVPALIESIGGEVGRLVDDAEQALVQLTGRSFHGDAALWREWWAANKESFEIGGALAQGEAEAGKREEGKDVPGHVSFYGISTRSKRILFVLDRSGSMNDPVGKGATGPGAQKKIDAAKIQLKAALAGLADGDLFNIITYAVDVERWQKRMAETSSALRKKTVRYVDALEAAGGTNIYDALEQAFRLAGIGAMDKAYESNVDTIFFLTDGQPTAGEVQDPAEILRRVKEWNRLARVVVHTVGVGLDHDAAFLRRLAEENGGQYVSR